MNKQLARLFQEDQSDTVTFRGAESFLSSQPRRNIAERIVAEGACRTADDYFHAAMLLQHGEKLEHWQQARELALEAARLGHPRALYLAAAALDRWLLRQGKPQKYGTNSVPDKAGWRAGDYDTATTDEERAEWDVPPLAELLERPKRLAEGRSPAEAAADPVVTVELAGTRIGLFNLHAVDSGRALPSYMVVAPGDLIPRRLPPGLSPWRFDNLWCARDSSGEVSVTWHYCAWRPLSEGLTAEEVSAAVGTEPVWLNEEGRVWSRLAGQTAPGECWLVGGAIPRADLLLVINSLHPYTTDTE